MKKVLYIFSSLAITLFTACDPMEEVYEELDAQYVYAKTFAVTLTADHYEAVEDADGVPSHVWEGHYLASEAEAGEVVPLILNASYPQLEKGSVAQVTYNKFNGTGVTDVISYEITERADYTLGGARYANFDRWAQINTFLNAKFPAEEAEANDEPVEGRLVKLTYTWYDGSGSPTSKTVTNAFYYINGEWTQTYMVTNEDYVTVNRNRRNNFVAADDDKLETYFNRFLQENDITVAAGEVYYVSYVYYNGSGTAELVTPLTYNGANWRVVSEDLPVTAFMQFKKDANGVWKPDLSIAYTLTSADYAWIGSNPELGTDAARNNLNSYGNLSTYNWTNADIIEALGAVLKYRFPEAEVGQKFAVTYNTYPAGNLEMTLVLNESGVYEVEQ